MTQMTSLIGNPHAFPILQHWDFFNHAGVAPLPFVAGQAFRQYATQGEAHAYLASHWYRDIETLRQAAAGLINAHRDEIAFVKNTSEGISIVAQGLDWQWGDKIVTTGVEYPANIYPWMDVAKSRGVKLIMVPEEDQPDGSRAVTTEKIISAASEPRVRLIAISHVEYASGQRHDLEKIGKFCSENNILLAVDAIQSLGVLPVDVKAMHIDYLSADGHKWMLGPEGAGFFYCRRELIERTRPLMIGAMNVVNAQNYGDYDFTLRPDAGRFECGSSNVSGLLAFKASLEMLIEAGIEKIGQRVKGLTDLLIKDLKDKGYHIISPRTNGQWSGIVSFASEKYNHEQILLKLRKEHRIEIAIREKRLRCSPHFYNTEAQLEKMAGLLPAHFEI